MHPAQITRLGKIILLGLMLGGSALTARAAGLFGLVIVEEAPGSRREIQSGGEQPQISFIDSPSATCVRPVADTGHCYIEWNYLNVSASSGQYVISMTVEIDDRVRAYHSGFFQTSMFIPGDLYGDGFQVTCGRPDADGWGKTYAYTLRARETGGLSAANYGSVTCPGDEVKVFMPLILR